jgi:hypothetical protein
MLNPIDEFFSDIPDPRTGRNVRYPLNEILLVAVVTLLSGGQGYIDMADTGRAKRDFLEKYASSKEFMGGLRLRQFPKSLV